MKLVITRKYIMLAEQLTNRFKNWIIKLNQNKKNTDGISNYKWKNQVQ